MGKQFDKINEDHRKFIEDQHMFFSGTAAREGKVNVSPKGMDSLRIKGPNRVIWVNYTGSGNETAGHLQDSPRMTLMWCSFTKRPMILRLYGTAQLVHREHADWDMLISDFEVTRAARQIYDMTVEMVQTSCGYSIPYFDHVGERPTLRIWAAGKSDEDIENYWRDRNGRTLDGIPTGTYEANTK